MEQQGTHRSWLKRQPIETGMRVESGRGSGLLRGRGMADRYVSNILIEPGSKKILRISCAGSIPFDSLGESPDGKHQSGRVGRKQASFKEQGLQRSKRFDRVTDGRSQSAQVARKKSGPVQWPLPETPNEAVRSSAVGSNHSGYIPKRIFRAGAAWVCKIGSLNMRRSNGFRGRQALGLAGQPVIA
jgi:hypothetical protein